MNTTVEQELAEKGRAIIRTVGVSMEPMLHANRSTVALVRPERALRKNDVVLFRRGGEYVLHRIIRLMPDGRYVIKGDNCYGQDIVKSEAVIGLMEGYFPDESDTYIPCGCDTYRRYVRMVPLRHKKIQIEAIIYKIFKKMGLR